jgi:uncharacterized repeat protein (TIGR04138 family)
MTPAVTINCDLACVKCEYNLRGLMTDGKCPECGAPIEATLESVPPGEIPELEDVILNIRRRRYEPLASAAGASIDAVMIVHDAVRHATLIARRNSSKVEQRHATALDVCKSFREHAQFYFNDADEAKELLAEWGIVSSADVGRIVFAMVELGWAAAQPEDSVAQFGGLFTLDTLVDQAG